MNQVGLIAGSGRYPQFLFAQLRKAGVGVQVAAIQGQVNPADFTGASDYSTFPIGRFRDVARYFRAARIACVYMAGGIHKHGMWRHVSVDRHGLSLLPQLLRGGDDRLLRAVAHRFRALGIIIEDPRCFLDDALAGSGVLAGPAPNDKMSTMILSAWKSTRLLALEDTGQSIVWFGNRVSEVEGSDGTDALLSRAPGPGAILVKYVKCHQDRRFDLPAIGPSTVLAAKQVGARAIVVETGGVLMLDKERLTSLCNESGLLLFGIS